jgi:hypothetical protein
LYTDSNFDHTHTHAHTPMQWMMLSLINPPFTSRESIDSPDRALSSPLRSLSAAGAYRPSPKFIANASVRLSPFPSPIAGDMGSAFTPASRPLGGAFTPYKRPILKRPAKSPVMKSNAVEAIAVQNQGTARPCLVQGRHNVGMHNSSYCNA